MPSVRTGEKKKARPAPEPTKIEEKPEGNPTNDPQQDVRGGHQDGESMPWPQVPLA